MYIECCFNICIYVSNFIFLNANKYFRSINKNISRMWGWVIKNWNEKIVCVCIKFKIFTQNFLGTNNIWLILPTLTCVILFVAIKWSALWLFVLLWSLFCCCYFVPSIMYTVYEFERRAFRLRVRTSNRRNDNFVWPFF